MVVSIVVYKYRQLSSISCLGQEQKLWFDLWVWYSVLINRVCHLHDWSSLLRSCDSIGSDVVVPCVTLTCGCSLLRDIYVEVLIRLEWFLSFHKEVSHHAVAFFHDIVASLLSNLFVFFLGAIWA